MASSVLAELDLHPPGADLRGLVGVLIPAYNEAATLAAVVGAARQAALGPVLVVDDGSSDATAIVAREAGATVLRLGHNRGKGGAVHAGAVLLETDLVLLVDADLVGLRPEHLRTLCAPLIAGEVEMSRGVFTGGRWRTSAAQQLTPQLNGQRALERARLLAVPGLAASRYGLEIAITEAARREQWRTRDVPMPDVTQVMKEEKRGFWRGLGLRLGMYRDLLRAYWRR